MLLNRIFEHLELLDAVFEAFEGQLRLEVGLLPFVEGLKVDFFYFLYFHIHHLVLDINSD